VPLGRIDDKLSRKISNHVEETFHDCVDIGAELHVPQGSYDPERKQYLSTAILKEMILFRGKDIERVLGVADIDLSVPEFNFVFEEADISNLT
jgi:predicted Zn-dependent protease